ncbi:O-antigen ligase family protein [Bradyrhizobium sp. UFLA05-153]
MLALVAGLPWSTSLTSILGIVLFFGILTTIRTERMLATISHPAGALPLALVLLAAIGVIWASEVPWPERLSALGKMTKLLLLPLLLFHFQSSPRAKWVFATFVVSNMILLIYSFVASAMPELAIVQRTGGFGVPVRNYIDQSQGFSFVAVALAGLAFEAASRQMHYWAAALGAVSFLFFANLAFINVARTAFVYLPIMLVLLTIRYLSQRAALVGFIGVCILCGALWQTSPNLQRKVSAIFTELAAFQPDAQIGEKEPSAAERLEFWRKSFQFIERAPVLGHGTGSIRRLFEQESIGRTGISALIVSNPHNQTLAAAVQWGGVGILVLWAMWMAQVRLFCTRALVAWIGLLATVQNIASSVFNSHLMDAYEGWLYVLVVGIAGGGLLRIGGRKPAPLGKTLPAAAPRPAIA